VDTGWTDVWWQLTAFANAVILAAYLAISFAIGRGLWHARQWRNNPLGLATASIFFSCAVHHGGSSKLAGVEVSSALPGGCAACS
jgi:two-component system cell cycle sensor histidine kinase/response regulator CckA